MTTIAQQTDTTARIASNELLPIAQRLRDRQVEIDTKAKGAFGIIADILLLIRDQGRDIINSKAHLGRLMSWSEWLANHVPSLPKKLAAKYERVATENITDIRQGWFAFVGDVPIDHASGKKCKPFPWVSAHSYLSKFTRYAATLTEWPEDQVDNIREELEPSARLLWPDKFE